MTGMASTRFLAASLALLGLLVGLAGAESVYATGPTQSEGRMERAQRIAETPYPRIGTTWHPARGNRSLEGYLRHDLIVNGPWWVGLKFERKEGDIPEEFTAESIQAARRRMEEIKALHPNTIVIVSLAFFENGGLPGDHPWYLRFDEERDGQQWWVSRKGDRIEYWPGSYRMDICNPEYRARIVQQVVSLTEAGVDGVFFDNLGLVNPALGVGVDERPPWASLFKEVRAAAGQDFLIMANGGNRMEWAAPYLNGNMYEGFGHGEETDWDELIAGMQRTTALQPEPHINYFERFEDQRPDAGWPGDPERGHPVTRDPAARRWSLALALIIGDYYYLFSDSTHHAHDWYPEYDMKIGLPQAPGERITSHVWQRRYEKALVVVNLPGSPEPHEVELEQAARDSLTGRKDTRFSMPPGDGAILVFEESRR